MKSKLTALTLAGFIACCSSGFAQDNTNAPATNTVAETNGAVTNQPGAVIPLIVMDDVPLTDAIKNLARQANLNYILDPKINFGQPGTDGKVVPQPNISIRWENLSAEQALFALLNNYNLVLVDDPKTGIARITVRDPAAPDPLLTKIIQLKFASPSNILGAVQTVLIDKRSRVTADTRTSQLVVTATEKELIALDGLVLRLDTQTKQVLIEARLLEMSKNPTSVKGIDWSGTLEKQNLSFGNNLKSHPPVESLNNTLATSVPKMLMDTAKGFNPATAFLDADGVNVALSFLNKEADARVLSTPRAVTLDNQEAVLSVTRANPIFKNTAGTQGSPGGSEVTYTNLGTILRVTPRISANDYINLIVKPEVSSVAGVARKIVSGTVNEADIYDVRSITTEVMIPSGYTLVLGGLVSDDSSKAYTKVPILGDIPGIGLAFRHESKMQLKKNLIIFITPTIIQDRDFQPSQSQFLKTKPASFDDDKLTAWDSGKPKKWSNPFAKKKAPSADDDSTWEK